MDAAAHGRGVMRNDTDLLTTTLATVAARVNEQFSKAIMTKMTIQMPLYHAAGLFDHLRFIFETKQIHWAEKRKEWFDYLANLKGVRNSSAVRMGLDSFLTYQRAVREYNTQLSIFPDLQKPKELWMWWLKQRLIVPSFFEIACVLFLKLPVCSFGCSRLLWSASSRSSRPTLLGNRTRKADKHRLALRSMCL